MGSPSMDPLDRNAQRGLASSSWVVILAVVAVLGSVSLGRLHVFAVHQNERDALFLLERLAESLPSAPRVSAAGPSALGARTPGAGLDLRARLDEVGADFDRLGDVDWLAAGRVLRRHGYLFDLVPEAGQPAGWCLRAWPDRYGRTGLAAFVYRPGSGLLGHPNRPERWSGTSSAPSPPGVLDPGAPRDGWRGLSAAVLRSSRANR